MMELASTFVQLLEDWQIYKVRLRRLVEEGLVPREATDLVLELTKPRISLTEVSLRNIAEKLRQEAPKSVEEHGGDARRSRRTVMVRLNRPVTAYVAYDGKHVYLVRGIDKRGLPVSGQERGRELEKRVLEAIKRGEAETYPADLDERLLGEVELPSEAAKTLGTGRVPLALMLNLGWLLSDDWRRKITHTTARPGQAAVRLVHWLALAEWSRRRCIASVELPMFKLALLYATQTRKGSSPLIWTWPIGRTTNAIKSAYERFGVSIGDPERVKQHGYVLLKALREAAFERRGKAFAVKSIGSWLAFSAILKTLVLGDGSVMLTQLKIAVEEKAVRELADALGGTATRGMVYLHSTRT